jgi:hypothetical protein
LQILIFIFYLFIFSFIITIVPFFKNSGIYKLNLIALFIIKVLAGVAYGIFYTLPKYHKDSDTWRFYRLSTSETKWLLKSPFSFAKDLFYHHYKSSGNLFSGVNSYWNDLKSNLIIKITAVFNVLTGSSYYVNVIFFNFLFLIGLVAIFKALSSFFPHKKWAILFGIFLLPSTLFWCSGIHKDGLILSAIGVTIYCFCKLGEKKYALKYWVFILLSFLLIFSLRNYILFAMLPAIFCWMLCEKYPKLKKEIFVVCYVVGIMIVFIIPFFSHSINPLLLLSTKQHEFLQLTAGSQAQTDVLQPTVSSFISLLPSAVDMAFFRPHITEAKNLFYVLAIGENLLLIILVLFSIFRLNRQKKVPSIVLFLFAFSIPVLLICGYTIPFTGAIVRYRSLVLPLLVSPLLCISELPFLKKIDAFISAKEEVLP